MTMETGKGSAGADALRMLEADHGKVRELSRALGQRSPGAGREPGQGPEGRGAVGAGRAGLVRDLCRELAIHAALEEELFYPAARGALPEGALGLVEEAEVEHACATGLIRRIREGGGERLQDAEVAVLCAYVDHHLREEEQELFPRVRETGLDLAALGERMRARRAVLEQAWEAGRAPRGVRALADALGHTRRPAPSPARPGTRPRPPVRGHHPS
jgi:hemerythrin superfamily protein